MRAGTQLACMPSPATVPAQQRAVQRWSPPVRCARSACPFNLFKSQQGMPAQPRHPLMPSLMRASLRLTPRLPGCGPLHPRRHGNDNNPPTAPHPSI